MAVGAGLPGGERTTPPLPLPTKGPFSFSLDALFTGAASTVLARADIVGELEALQNPPDLDRILVGRQELFESAIAAEGSRCASTTTRLHELLVMQLAADPARLDELGWLVDATLGLQDIPRRFGARVPEGVHELRQYRLRWERRLNHVVPDTGVTPDDPHEALEVELASCWALLLEIEKRQVALLESVVPKAREQLEFRALVTEWEVQQRAIATTLESEVLSVTLGALNASLAEETAPRMRVKSFDGLRQSLTTERVVITDAYELLEQMIRQRNEGSFGVAGPRGVGKSTLIRFFTTTPGVRDLPGTEEYELTTWHRPRLGVAVSAPVAYEPRDFVLHLYAELCKRVIGEDEEATVRRGRGHRPGTTFAGRSVHRVRGALTALGAGAVTGGTGLLALAVLHRLPWGWHPVADLGAALVTVAAVTLTVLLCVAAAPAVTAYSGGFVWSRRTAGMGPVAAVSALSVAGLTVLLAGGGWRGGTWTFLAGLALAVVGFPAWRAAVVAGSVASLVDERDGSPPTMPGARLRELAFDHLRQIRYQQSFSHERSMTVKLGGGSGVPAGFDASGKRGETMQQVPKTYPELVGDLRTFLAAVAELHVVVVGVDELDKLRSQHEVENFLNDIKGVFGTAGCFFLVSVSEDAAASFERRGAPFRDVFDSAFDDVISVRRLDMRCARKVVYGLLLGWTKPFVGLCFVLSGGLARDLRRTARELVTHRDDNDEIDLGTATLAMCRREAEARMRAIRHELMRDPFDPLNVELLARIADLTPAEATAPALRRWHRELVGWTTGTHEPADPSPAPARLGLELAAFLLFAATVIEFFDPSATPDRIREAEKPEAGAKCLSTLALARRSLASSPGTSAVHTQRFRTAWGLAT
jgi:hypothetical protein